MSEPSDSKASVGVLRIGLLHPGAMGAAVGAALRAAGHEVLWASEGRSPATLERADAAGLVDAGSIDALAVRCDAVVSVCPPHAAQDVVDRVLGAGFRGLYLDANAVAPASARAVGDAVTAAGGTFVDGGIIGGPPTRPGTTWLHLAGAEAPRVAAWFAAGPFETSIVSDRPGDASALKVAFAAWTKGSTALRAAMLAYAEAAGVREALRTQWEAYEPGFLADAEAKVQRSAWKAWRFEGEMHQIAAAFDAEGVQPEFHLAAAETYRRLSPLRDADAPEGKPELARVLAALRAEGER
ncbi:MAG: DUF1932 domain-containing protein [Trueperaceae bacterium]|nr:DUF1932 domain-containing protein [Trueperaceae bacterium]